MLLPGMDSTTGTNDTTQTSPLLNVDAPINVCSVSAGVLADAASSCSTTSVGTDQLGAIANINVPITASDNAVGLLGMAASALGLNTTTTSASTTQNGAINVAAPITICAINVGLLGNTSSACDETGTSGTTTQTGVIDATVPVTVCDVIVEIAGDSTSNCPQDPDTVKQSGELADLYAPVGICGVIVEIDGAAAGKCMPTAGFPLVNGLPTNQLSQSAPIDGVLPVNACSILIAVDGDSNQLVRARSRRPDPDRYGAGGCSGHGLLCDGGCGRNGHRYLRWQCQHRRADRCRRCRYRSQLAHHDLRP
jgi:hypothetical protein